MFSMLRSSPRVVSKIRSSSLTLTFVFLCASVAYAETILVPDDYDSIQEAIDEAEDDDVIEVSEGTYDENINFLGKAITVIAVDGPDETTIDGGGSDSVVVFDSDEKQDSVLDGFTITNGSAIHGAGIFGYRTSPTIQNCVIVDNHASNGISGGTEDTACLSAALGGGFFFSGIGAIGDDPVVLDCVIVDNTAEACFLGAGGGGMFDFSVDNPLFEGNLVSGNSVSSETLASRGGGIYVACLEGEIRRNVIVENTADMGAGMVARGLAEVLNNTIYGNIADSRGGGLLVTPRPIGTGEDAVVVRNCIIWGNEAEASPQISVYNLGNDTLDIEAEVSYCNIEDLPFDYEGDGNIDEDPLFADVDEGDFRLTEDSPCIDAGDPDDPDDPDDTTVDIGAFYYVPLNDDFLRGDVDANGTASALVDSIALLEWAFGDGEEPTCMDAADVDDGGTVSALIDSLALLGWAFQSLEEPPEPGPDVCGDDPTSDDLDCATGAVDCN